MGAVLGQQIERKPTAICCASKTLAEAHINYTTTKELLVVVYALEKFWPDIFGEQGYHLYRSRGPKVLALQERGKAMIGMMGATSSKIRLRDQRQEGQ